MIKKQKDIEKEQEKYTVNPGYKNHLTNSN